MQRSIVIKSGLLAVIFFIWIHAADLQTVGFSRSNPDKYHSRHTSLSLIDSIPQHNSGILNSAGVPDDTSFGVLVESQHGIDLTDSDSIRFEIDDGVHFPYRRDLSSDTMRVVRVEDDDPHQTLIWVVYDRSLETLLPPLYFPGKFVQITVSSKTSIKISFLQENFDLRLSLISATRPILSACLSMILWIGIN